MFLPNNYFTLGQTNKKQYEFSEERVGSNPATFIEYSRFLI